MKTDSTGGTTHCACTAPQIRRYLAKISGPLLDRIDIQIEVPRLSSEELMGKRAGESSATVGRRVVKAREKQLSRKGGCNGQMKAKELREYCEMTADNRGFGRGFKHRDSPRRRGDQLPRVRPEIVWMKEHTMKEHTRMTGLGASSFNEICGHVSRDVLQPNYQPIHCLSRCDDSAYPMKEFLKRLEADGMNLNELWGYSEWLMKSTRYEFGFRFFICILRRNTSLNSTFLRSLFVVF